MTIKELTEKGAIYFSQLKTGLSQYQTETAVMGQEQAYHFFLEKLQKEYSHNAYADFYYFSLPKEAQQKVDAILEKEELLYLGQLSKTIGQKKPMEELEFPIGEPKEPVGEENSVGLEAPLERKTSVGEQKGLVDQKEAQKELETGAEEIIFPLDEKLLQIITKLNQAEMLFSTIYFTGEKGKRSTWWGNYGEEYLAFWEK